MEVELKASLFVCVCVIIAVLLAVPNTCILLRLGQWNHSFHANFQVAILPPTPTPRPPGCLMLLGGNNVIETLRKTSLPLCPFPRKLHWKLQSSSDLHEFGYSSLFAYVFRGISSAAQTRQNKPVAKAKD